MFTLLNQIVLFYCKFIWLITSLLLQEPFFLGSQESCTTIVDVDLLCEEELPQTSDDEEEEDLIDEQLAAANCKMQQQTLPGVIK